MEHPIPTTSFFLISTHPFTDTFLQRRGEELRHVKENKITSSLIATIVFGHDEVVAAKHVHQLEPQRRYVVAYLGDVVLRHRELLHLLLLAGHVSPNQQLHHDVVPRVRLLPVNLLMNLKANVRFAKKILLSATYYSTPISLFRGTTV